MSHRISTGMPKSTKPISAGVGENPIFGAMHRGAYLVGVAGGSGSGKTTLVRALCESLPEGMACLVSQDDYYHPKEAQHIDANGKVNFDLPSAVDLDALARDLGTLVAGDPILRKEYLQSGGKSTQADRATACTGDPGGGTLCASSPTYSRPLRSARVH